MSRKTQILLVVILCILLVFSFIYSRNLPYEISLKTLLKMENNNSRRKMILTWTTFFGMPMTHERYLAGCPFNLDCYISTHKNDYAKADALVFHPSDMSMNQLPPGRTPIQLYVVLSHESPPHTGAKAYAIPYFFNWSMTYRMDSDVPYPYSYIVKTGNQSAPLDDEWSENILQENKTKLIAWFVSNCGTPSKRELYAKELANHIQLDIYGQCGTLQCPKNDYEKCERKLSEEYKFYLAFENSLCNDYVTEKFYARTSANSVPIVLKRSIAEKLFPAGSFIAADDFGHPKKLAQYLKYLHANDTAYLEFFRWRGMGYRFVDHDPKTGYYFGFCGLCQKMLQIPNSLRPTKSYGNFKYWWNGPGQCDESLVQKLLAEKV